MLRCSPFSKSNKISAGTYRALSLDLSTEALDVTDKAMAPKRISAFLRLCAVFIPCEHAEYDEAVVKLNAEVADDLADAKLTFEDVQDNFVSTVVELESRAPSVLLQVLYALHLGHVQFLMADYKSRIIEAYPHIFAKVRKPRLGKDGLPLKIKDVNSAANPSDNTVDMSAVEDDHGTTSDIDPNDGQEVKLTLSPPPSHRKYRVLHRKGRQHLLEIAKRLASAPTPRHVMKRATMTS